MEIVRQTDARKERFGPDDAVRLAREAAQLWVARGKKVRHFDMKKAPPSDEELKKLLIGPSGNLRAPTVRRGNKLFVGFEQEQFEQAMLS